MFKRYLRDIIKSLVRTPVGSAINVLGMSLGIAIFILIMLYVRSEITVNRDFPEYNNIYRISRGDGNGWQGTPAKLGEILVSNLPEIRSFVRVGSGGAGHVVKVNNIPAKIGELVFVDSTFFSLFPLEFLFGDRKEALTMRNSVVLTSSVADRLFPGINPVGEVLMMDQKFELTVTGVVEDPGQKTHITGDVFIMFNSLPVINNWPDAFDCYTCYNYQTYLLLDRFADRDKTVENINVTLDRYGTENSIISLVNDQYTLTNLYDVYFGPEERPRFRKGNITQLRFLTAIGLIIIIIGLINYINLATAQAGSKLHQLALRKALGASRSDLVASIMGEAVVVSLVAVNLGLILLEILKPLFNTILSLDLKLGYFEHPWMIAGFLLFGIVTGLLAGFYPALTITRFDMSASLQGRITATTSGGRIRKILTILQVTISMIMLGCTIVIYTQLRYINRTDLGFDKELLVFMYVNNDIKLHKEAFKDDLLSYSGIEKVAYSYSSYRTNNERWGFDFNDINVTLHMEGCDEDYIETLGLEIVKGRDFHGKQDDHMLIVNEAACRQYFGDDPIGTRVDALGENTEIIGVVKDFRFLTFHNDIEPIGIIFRPDWAKLCSIRLSGSDMQGTIRHMESVWQKYCPDYPFEYHFVDKLYESRYRKEIGIGRLLIFFSIASVLIACLGIFGLVTFSVMKRSGEVGIRKASGASAIDIVRMLSLEMSMTIVWSVIPAFAVITIVMNRWLSGFVFHTRMHLWIYLASALIIWFVAMISTIGRTLKTSRIQPAEVLRNN